jgi:hypothetical protein
MWKRIAFVPLVLLPLCASIVFGGQETRITEKLAALARLPAKFSFIVLGDNRAGDPAGDAVYGKLIASALERKPDVLMNTGDEINKPGDLDDWKRFHELSRSVRVPYFLTVGNHDVHPEVAGSERTYKDQVVLPGNELYYSFVAGNALFVVLDSNIKGQEKRITGEQFRWLELVLAASKEEHRFVFVHHPLFPEAGKGRHRGNSLDRYKDERDRLHRLFVRYRVTAVFAGHEHLYLRKRIDGVLYVITGGGGAPLYAKDEDGGFHHFVRIMVDGDSVTGEVVDVNGRIRDTFYCGVRNSEMRSRGREEA